MSLPTTQSVYAPSRAQRRARTLDYLELTKPKIAALELVTVAVAAFVAGWVPASPLTLVHVLLGTGLLAASASALNQWLERHTDRLMQRTAARPLPTGRLGESEVLGFAAATVIAGLAYLLLTTNLLTAGLGLATWILYVAVYTPLKAKTRLNTTVGAVAGALPILMGWVAGGVPDSLADWGRALTLFGIVFLWQYPHFMAIAWIYRRQYRSAGLQMSPVVDPSGRHAGRQAVCGAAALLGVSLLPAWIQPGVGTGYFLAALALGLWMLVCSVRFRSELSHVRAQRLMRASVVYLPALLLVLMFSPWI